MANTTKRSAAAAAAAKKRQQRDRRRLVVASAVLAAGAVAAGALFAAQAGDAPRSGVASARALPPLEVETGVVHVHGLGVDPADGVLYAATHSGLFRLAEQGRAERVANRAQDTMGFSVVGPGTFIGSGHPDPREDDVRPPLLGLIESTDRGETWNRLSLHGKADFHALHAAHGQVYGYDSTSSTFMVTSDRKNWDRRAKLPMRDFAVSPAGPDTVLAATQRGLALSTDGGRAFRPVAGAPVLAVLAWAEQDSLYGVGPDGTVHHSKDGGATWTRRGTVGEQPEAVTVDVRNGKETLYVAAGDRGILASSDGGTTFTTRYQE
jgi:hypothetical protein